MIRGKLIAYVVLVPLAVLAVLAFVFPFFAQAQATTGKPSPARQAYMKNAVRWREKRFGEPIRLAIMERKTAEVKRLWKALQASKYPQDADLRTQVDGYFAANGEKGWVHAQALVANRSPRGSASVP